MTFANWLDTFITEKRIDTEQTITVQGRSGTNVIPVGCVLDAMKQASRKEQAGIKTTLVKIDFMNGDVLHFIRHLAQALAI